MRAAGFVPGVPRVQMYTPIKSGGMGHEHAYTYAAAALCDQFDRALCGGKGEPARLAVEDAMASACCRLGGGARQHPLAWWPAHLEDELRDDLLAEAYWKACLRLGRRSVCTAGCEGRSGLLSAAAWRPSAEHLRRMGPALWEDGMWEGAATHRCVFVRELAAHGLDSWASVTDAATRGWLS